MPEPKPRILCLEDDQDTRDLVAILLEKEGYGVVAVETIAEAARLVESNGFALYIVDERLPDGEGLDFIRKVRAAGRKTPIIVHSAGAYQKDIDAAMSAGANEYLVKPEGWSNLCRVVDALIQ